MALSSADALQILLPTEAFLLAAVSVVQGTQAGKVFVSAIRLPDWIVPVGILLITASVAVGALGAWWPLYGGDVSFSGDGAVGFGLLAAVVGQPLLTIVLAIGMFEWST